MTATKDKTSNDNDSIEELEKRVKYLREKCNELDKQYIEYLEVDMNRQAGMVSSKKYKIEKEINLLNGRIQFKKNILKIKEEEMYGISQKIKKDLKLYEMFINEKGLLDEFENFKDEQEEEEHIL